MKAVNTILILGAAIQSVSGYGELGHRTVAYVAEKYLTPEAKLLTNELLANNNSWDISDAAIWADMVKRKPEYRHTGAWHFIDAEDDPFNGNCNVKYERDCDVKAKCVVSALANMTERINDESLDLQQQKEALMFIIHFLGDIHQPLHTEHYGRGGNDLKVNFNGSKTNLHAVWDTHIPMALRGLPVKEGDDPIIKAAASAWAKDLASSSITPALLQKQECVNLADAQGCALKWATESNAKLCSYVLKPGKDWLEQNDLDGVYYQGATSILEDSVRKGGLRLAAWLNAIAAARSSATFVVQSEDRMEM